VLGLVGGGALVLALGGLGLLYLTGAFSDPARKKSASTPPAKPPVAARPSPAPVKPKAPDPVKPKEPGGGAPAAWVMFTDPDNTFRVNFPARPVTKKTQWETTVEVKTPDAVYAVEYTDLSDERLKESTPRQFIDEVSNWPNATISRKTFELAGKYPATDVVARAEMDNGAPARHWGRDVLVGKRHIGLRVYQPNDKLDEGAARRFIDSFEILREPPAVRPAPPTKESPTPRDRPAEKVEKAEKADFTLTAEQFDKEVSDNKEAAEAKYKGMTIELTGTVQGAGKDLSGDGHLWLAAGTALFGVQCFTTDQKPWEKATLGQKVRIRGQYPEVVGLPALVGCTIVEVSGPKAPVVQAADLAKEYAADAEATEMKYKDQWLLLAGEVTQTKAKGFGAGRVYLRGGEKVKVVCNLTSLEKEEEAAVAVGRRVKVLGQFSRAAGGEGEVGLNMCVYLGKED